MEDQQKQTRRQKYSEIQNRESPSLRDSDAIEERVQFRVTKKIAKVIFQSNDWAIVKKAICVELG